MAVDPSQLPNVVQRMRKDWPVGDDALGLLCSHLEYFEFPKRHQLVRAGVRCPYAYFIESGLTRSFWLVDGEEITTSFTTYGAVVFSMDELYYNKTSEEFVETIEPVRAFRISVADLRQLMSTEIDLANWSRIIHQNEYRRLHMSHKERLTLPARERYEAFCRDFPLVSCRANLAYIASYLGITPATLSRLRRGRKACR